MKQLEDDHGLTVLALNYYVGARHFLTKEPFSNPADLAPLKVRTPGAPVWQETIRALGATPMVLPWIETYPALQQVWSMEPRPSIQPRSARSYSKWHPISPRPAISC